MTITLTNQIELAKAGAAISVVGELSASKFQLSRTNQSTPALDLQRGLQCGGGLTAQTRADAER